MVENRSWLFVVKRVAFTIMLVVGFLTNERVNKADETCEAACTSAKNDCTTLAQDNYLFCTWDAQATYEYCVGWSGAEGSLAQCLDFAQWFWCLVDPANCQTYVDQCYSIYYVQLAGCSSVRASALTYCGQIRGGEINTCNLSYNTCITNCQIP